MINNGDEYTCSPRTLLYIRAFRSEYMYVSTVNSKPDVNANGWVDYSTRLPYVFTSDEGMKAIFVWFKDFAGNISEVAVDTIILDNSCDYPAHDSIVLDTTPPNNTPPVAEVDRISSAGVEVTVTCRQQDTLVNGVRSGLEERRKGANSPSHSNVSLFLAVVII